MSEVEIIWPAALERSRLGAAADLLEAAGVETTCRIQPVRRGPETAVLILMTTTALEPFLKALFQRVGTDAYTALKGFVSALFGAEAQDERGDAPDGEDGPPAPEVVVFESTVTGAQFLFTAGLPGTALEQALELQPGDEPGRWMWDHAQERWLRFEGVDR